MNSINGRMDISCKPSNSKLDPNVTVDLFDEEVSEIVVITIDDDDSEDEINISSDLFGSDEDGHDKWTGGMCERSPVSLESEMDIPTKKLSEPYSGPKRACVQSTSEDDSINKVQALSNDNVRLKPDLKKSRSFEEQLIRKKLDSSLEKMHQNDLNKTRSFGHYMQLKKDKLRYQVNILSKSLVVSNLFKGISIFVSGYTTPTALELCNLIQTHGGIYHCYYEHGVTTYTVASSLVPTKATKIRKNEKFIKPDWIVDSIGAGRLLDANEYLLLTTQQKSSIITAFHRQMNLLISNDSSKRNIRQYTTFTAKDPNFLEEYYARSRLHLISTLAQEMKDYVNMMREEQNHEFIGQHNLGKICDPNWKGSSGRIIFHVDLDCFFVSVSLRSRPDLVGKAVAVTHSKGSSHAAGFSELASVSYAARAAGLRNGMLVRDALKLCPTLICLPYEFNEYKIISKAIYTIVSRYTLDIRAISCDEMYIDCTKLLELLCISDAKLFAEHLRSEIKLETGCPASIGIGSNMLIARLATRYAKPDNVKWVKTDAAINFISNEKVENLPGLGHCTLNKLRTVYGNLKHCHDLQKVTKIELEKLLGKKLGEVVFKMCRGEDETDRDFMAYNVRKSISCDINYGIRFTKMEEVVHFLNVIGQELEKKLNQAKMVTRSVTLKIMVRSERAPIETSKYMGHGKCDTHTKTAVVDSYTGNGNIIANEAVKLLKKISAHISDIRGIGVQCGRLAPSIAPESSAKAEAMNRLFRVKKSSQEKVKTKGNEKQEICKPVLVKKKRELPYVYTTTNPTFFGESNVMKIKHELKLILRNMPTEGTVDMLTDYLFLLLRGRSLSTLLSICKYLYRDIFTSYDTHEQWFFTINYIFQQLDSLCSQMFGAPMVLIAVNKMSF